MKLSNFFIILMALPLALPLLAMEPHTKQATIDGYLTSYPTSAPLIKAAVAGNALQVTELLVAGASVDEEDKSHCTSLTWSAGLEHRKVCNILIAYRANFNYLWDNFPWISGQTPLMAAAENRQDDICTLLIKSNADVFKQNKSGWNALNYAQNQDASDTCKLVIDAMLKPTKKETDSAYFLLAFLNKKYRSAKDTNKLIVKYLLHKSMQLKKPMVIAEIKKVGRPPGLIDYMNKK